MYSNHWALKVLRTCDDFYHDPRLGVKKPVTYVVVESITLYVDLSL